MNMKSSMDKKKILIVSHYFYPLNNPRSLRTIELVLELVRRGHDVTVLASLQDQTSAYAEKHGFKVKDLGRLKWKGIELKGRGIEGLVRKVMRRLSIMLLDFPEIELVGKVKRALKKESGYDLLISIATPHPVHWGVARVWRKGSKNNPAKMWVADCGDPYMLDKSDTFKKLFYFKYPEKDFCRKVDFIAVPFEGAKDGYYPEFRDKIRVIPQGFRFPEISGFRSSENNGFKGSENNGYRFNENNGFNLTNKIGSVTTFGYSGNITSYRHYAIPFFKFLNSVKEDFKFVIYTKDRAFYEQYLSKDTLKKCEFHGYLDRPKLLQKLSKMDFLLHFPYQNEFQRSLKLVDYHYLQVPIISMRDDEESFDNFYNFLNGDYSGRIEPVDIDEFRIEVVTNKFMELCS